jgi:hypothetical protein
MRGTIWACGCSRSEHGEERLNTLLSGRVVRGARIHGRKKLPSAVNELWSLMRAKEGNHRLYYVSKVA